jgi:hypothetical protein
LKVIQEPDARLLLLRVHVSGSKSADPYSIHHPQELIVQPLGKMVECVVPRVSPASARVVAALVGTRGFAGRAHLFARSMGFRNRDQLRRALAADGLPCLEDLASWIRLLGWVVDAETLGMALSRGALHSGKDPRSWYRTVHRLTGRPWGEVRALGSGWVLLQMSEAWNETGMPAVSSASPACEPCHGDNGRATA